MSDHEIITRLVKTTTDRWAKENMDIIKSHVDRLFENVTDPSSVHCRNPVTDDWDWDAEDPVALQKLAARRALLAREHFALFGPSDAPPLPVSYDERESIKFGKLPYMVSLYARSLGGRHYDLHEHPPFATYACGVMASELAPGGFKNDEDLGRRFPPRLLKVLGPGLIWQPPAKTTASLRRSTAYRK